MKLLRKIFFPIVPIYYVVTSLRNKLFDLNVFKSKSYNLPVICVGNLSVGGTGKTPMIEYLIRLLKDDNTLATLSRGYKRSTSGFKLANGKTKVDEIGDEPYQFHQKFQDILVAVDENRQHGIDELLKLDNSPEVILLDDAFQHRKVKAGFNILLTTYSNLYADDIMLPTGDLREPRKGAERADIVVVTKCPTCISDIEKNSIRNKLNLNDNQSLFFSSIAYEDSVFNDNETHTVSELKDKDFTLVTGIANSKPLVDYLKSESLNFEHLNYKDHYNFTGKDLEFLNQKQLIITTEKDFVRLNNQLTKAKLFYLPIKVEIDNANEFNKLVKEFVVNF